MSSPVLADIKPVKVNLSRGQECHFCTDFSKFNKDDLATWRREMALLSGVMYSGFDSPFN